MIWIRVLPLAGGLLLSSVVQASASDVWQIRRHTDLSTAMAVGAKCSAVQLTNGAEIELTADMEHPANKRMLRLFVAYGGEAQDARVFIDDGQRTNVYLDERVPQRQGFQKSFDIADLTGKQLFVTFSIGTMPVGRYEFPIGNIKTVAARLHRHDCLIEMAPSKAIGRSVFDKIHTGQSYAEVERLIGDGPDSITAYSDTGVNEYIWNSAGHPITILFDMNLNVIDKKQ